MEWNFSERRRGVDKWPEAEATVTSIEQPFTGPKFDFLSLIAFTFQDKSGEYYAGKFQMPTSEFPSDFMTGSKITIRYNPRNPNQNWCEDDYFRSGFGRVQSFDFPVFFWSLVLFMLLLVGIIFIVKSH